MENVIDGWNLGRSFGYLTKQYIGALTAKLEGVPVQRYYYPLYIIGKSSGKICQQQLADQLLMDKVSIVRILNALTEDGYIERKVNPEDRREHLLHITKKGKPWVKSIENSLKETDAQFLSFLPERNRASFRKNLILLIEVSKGFNVENVELFYNRTKEIIND